MQVVVADYTEKKSTPIGPWSKLHGRSSITSSAVDYLTPQGEDQNTVTFCYHYKEGAGIGAGQLAEADQYQDIDTFKSQVALASNAFAQCDFQLITFNVPEQEKFGSSMAELGFQLMSSAKGRSNTPIYLYVKTKGQHV